MENQSVNLFLWVPFLMAFGAGIYFNITNEPNLAICIAGLILGTVFSVLRTRLSVCSIALLVFGFCYAAVFTHIINTPQIPCEMHNLDISGVVEHIDYTADKSRIYMRIDAADIHAGNGDAVVRVSARSDITPPNIGDIINARIGLFRPNCMDAPETFDYARWSYFNGISATGYINSYDVITHGPENNIDEFRNRMHNIAD